MTVTAKYNRQTDIVVVFSDCDS